MNTTTFLVAPDGPFPNNPDLPLVVHSQAMVPKGRDPAALFEARFADYRWGHAWRNGIFAFHHYHSTAHEVLGVYRGTARVRFGGPRGVAVGVQAGDVVIIPAGVAHQRLTSSPNFAVVGAYPLGQIPDMCYGKPAERPGTDENIQATPLPEADPVCGLSEGLMRLWCP